MNITVFGASGAIGSQFVDLAIQRGHGIRAVYRTTPSVSPRGQVEILVNPDIFNLSFVTQAIRGVDVVVTALGPNFTQHHNAMTKMISPPDLHRRLARTLVRAMQDTGAATKVIAVSTGSMGPADAVMGLGPRLLLSFFRTFIARNLRLVGKDLSARSPRWRSRASATSTGQWTPTKQTSCSTNASTASRSQRSSRRTSSTMR